MSAPVNTSDRAETQDQLDRALDVPDCYQRAHDGEDGIDSDGWGDGGDDRS